MNRLFVVYVVAIFSLIIGNSFALSVYHGQEFYKNFSRAAVAYKNTGTIIVSCGSQSMWPEFTCDDRLIMVPAKNISVGDVVAYLGGGRWKTDYVMHRVVSVWREYKTNRTYYVTKGDNNKYPDPWPVYDYQVKWKIVGKWVRATV